MIKVIARVYAVHLMNVDWAPGGHQPSDQASRLGLSPPKIGSYHSHPLSPLLLLLSPYAVYSFYRLTWDGRLSRPRHCSKGTQPVPKAVYRSGCRDKHNSPPWDSNLGHLKPHSDSLTTIDFIGIKCKAKSINVSLLQNLNRLQL